MPATHAYTNRITQQTTWLHANTFNLNIGRTHNHTQNTINQAFTQQRATGTHTGDTMGALQQRTHNYKHAHIWAHSLPFTYTSTHACIQAGPCHSIGRQAATHAWQHMQHVSHITRQIKWHDAHAYSHIMHVKHITHQAHDRIAECTHIYVQAGRHTGAHTIT